MARDILFKAKRIDNGEWVRGGTIVQFLDGGVRSFFIPQFNETCICEHDEITDDILSFSDCRFYKVDGNTLCQYTGLTDKNGNKIWENDVVKYKNADGIKFNGTTLTVIGKVVYNEKTASFAVYGKDEIGGKHCDYFPIKNVEVIGNIFDNPELLEGGA